MTDKDLDQFTMSERPLNSISIRYVKHRGEYLLEYIGDSDDDTEIATGDTKSEALRDLADRLEE